ncbi:hypothetical protein LCGC14_2869970, partial [marine sediment metagenome]
MKKKYLGILTKRFLEKEYTKNKKSTKAIAKMLDCHKDTVLNKLNKFKKFLRLGCKDKKLTLKHKKKLSKAHKGIITWNTGLTKKTDKRVMNHSIILKEIWNKPEYVQFAKERRAKIIYPIKDSSIEIIIQNFLKLLHIEFITHYYISEITHSYQCDILIPSKKIIIEADGSY